MHNEEEKDGIRYPSIDQLEGKASSKYKLVIAVAKRAREIYETNETALAPDERKNVKPIGIALEEIVANKAKIL